QRPLQHLVAAVAAEASAGRDHAVAGHVGAAASFHDVADGARGARASCELGDVAVRRHASRRNAPHDGEHAELKRIGGLFQERAYWMQESAWPSAFIVSPAMAASVGARSAGGDSPLYF